MNLPSINQIFLVQFLAFCPLALQAASFDCAKASTQVEKSICGNQELSQLDEELAKVYSEASQEPATEFEVKAAQRKWIAERNSCQDEGCLIRAYENRLSELRSSIGAGLVSRTGTDDDAGIGADSANRQAAVDEDGEAVEESETAQGGVEGSAEPNETFGYKAIKFGMTFNEICDLGVCGCTEQDKRQHAKFWKDPTLLMCYEIAGEKRWFEFRFDSNKKLDWIKISLGKFSNEIFDKFDAAIDGQYELFWEYTDEQQLEFNFRKRSMLCNLYHDGHVGLCVLYSSVFRVDVIELNYVSAERIQDLKDFAGYQGHIQPQSDEF